MTKYDLLKAIESLPSDAEILIGDYLDCLSGLPADMICYDNELKQIIISIYSFEKIKEGEIKQTQETIYEEDEFPYPHNEDIFTR